MSYTLKHNGKTVELPDFQALPMGVIRQSRKLDASEQIWFVLESVLKEKDLAVLDSMTITEFTTAINEWTQGAPLGESLQSSKS
jgi:hypothetical protein